MIDTDKYEGHDLARGRVGSDYNIYDRKGNIIFDADDVGSNMATLNLLADAPLLLEEVKRLRELLSIDEGSRDEGYCVTMRLEGCEYIGTLRLYKDEEGKVIE